MITPEYLKSRADEIRKIYQEAEAQGSEHAFDMLYAGEEPTDDTLIKIALNHGIRIIQYTAAPDEPLTTLS